MNTSNTFFFGRGILNHSLTWGQVSNSLLLITVLCLTALSQLIDYILMTLLSLTLLCLMDALCLLTLVCKTSRKCDRRTRNTYFLTYLESSDNEPICHDLLNNIFNWTATYKLNSDILFSYILVRDKRGSIVAPKTDIEWEETLKVPKVERTVENKRPELLPQFIKKSKAAAWIVSNCKAKSKRNEYAYELQAALRHYRLYLDIYGNCGKFMCPKEKENLCDALLEKHYFFYLSFENSFAEDYVTEKLLRAVKNNMVPIVLGGANYSRFLPPKSYLNVLEYKPEQLAKVMASVIRSPKLYMQYFEWKKYYTLENATAQNMCRLCEALNNKDMVETTSIYTDFRKWWNEHECQEVY